VLNRNGRVTFEVFCISDAGNGLGYKYNYGIVHGHHGSHHGSSYPHAYGGYDGPGYHIGGGYYNHV
jgi:hypothetical protein